MSNLGDVKRKTPVKVQLGEHEMTLRYTLNSFAEMEDRYGSVDAALAALEKGSVRGVIFMLYCGLIPDQPDITEREIGNLVEMENMQALADAMGLAMEGDLPKENETAGKKGAGPKS